MSSTSAADQESTAIPRMNYDGNLAEQWRRFKRKLQFYIDSKFTTGQLTNQRKVGVLMTALGDPGLDIFETFNLADDANYADILSKFDNYYNPKKNLVYERFVFNQLNQLPTQPVDDFIVKLKKHANQCEFHSEEYEKLIRDRLVSGITSIQLREELLRIPDLELEKATSLCRAFELSKKQAQLMDTTQPSSMPIPVEALKSTANVMSRNKQINQSSVSNTNHARASDCYRCGGVYNTQHECPAVNKTCNYCKIVGHFAFVCKKKKRDKTTSMTKSVAEVQTSQETLSSIQYPKFAADELRVLKIDSCATSGLISRVWYINLKLHNTVVKFKVDTGSQCNVIAFATFEKIVPSPVLQPTSVLLKPFGVDQLIRPIGRCIISRICFYVINEKVSFDNLLGFETALTLGLIRYDNRKTIDLNEITCARSYKDATDCMQNNFSAFNGLGKIPGKCKLILNPDCEPVIARNRRFAFTLLPRIKSALQEMIKLDVIAPVSEPTCWVSNMLAVERHKENNEIRICLDPTALNRALLIPKYPIPRPGDVIAQLSGKSCFSLFDLFKGFWHMELDDESSRYTTFQTPFGRFRYKRLCFGLSSAPEIFMKKIMEIFGDIPNCHPYFDDLIIATETEAEHDEIVARVFQRAKEFNVKFNPDKFKYKQRQVKYLGVIISQNSVAIDPERIRAICELPRPNDKKAIFRFLGLIKYVSNFIPNVASRTENLRNLTRNNVPFEWNPAHEKEFQELKAILTSNPVLAQFNFDSPITIQTDSSRSGIGSCLLQNGHPIAYASRALTVVEQKYSQIEKELLAIVFAVEKFHVYIYGRAITVESDHKPLQTILHQSFDRTTARLQRLRLRLLKYQLTVQYTPGSQMLIADTLSRAYLSDEPSSTLCTEYTVHCTSPVTASPTVHDQLIQSTLADPTLSQLIQYTQNGWPVDLQRLTPNLRKFLANRHQLSTDGKLIFLDNRIILPTSFRQPVLRLLHAAHSGIVKMKQAARQLYFWHGMSVDIESFVANCQPCQTIQPANCKEPLQLYPLTTRPFQRVSSDIFDHQSKSYLVIYDSFTCWLELFALRTQAASEVVEKMQQVFTRFGIPDQVVSDNVPYNSREYKTFAQEWNFEPIYSSPTYSQSNGFAEKGVDIAKKMVSKTTDWQYALLQYRNTPIPSLGYSPAQLLFGRILRTRVPTVSTQLQQQWIPPDQVTQKRLLQRAKQQTYYNRNAKELPQLSPGQGVYLQQTPHGNWEKGQIESVKDNRSYTVRTSSGGTYLRNRRFIRKPARYRD